MKLNHVFAKHNTLTHTHSFNFATTAVRKKIQGKVVLKYMCKISVKARPYIPHQSNTQIHCMFSLKEVCFCVSDKNYSALQRTAFTPPPHFP